MKTVFLLMIFTKLTFLLSNEKLLSQKSLFKLYQQYLISLLKNIFFSFKTACEHRQMIKYHWKKIG